MAYFSRKLQQSQLHPNNLLKIFNSKLKKSKVFFNLQIFASRYLIYDFPFTRIISRLYLCFVVCGDCLLVVIVIRGVIAFIG